MGHNYRSYRPKNESLRALLRKIDAQADDYIKRTKNPGSRYFATSYAFESLLEELESRHPLSMMTKRHGQRLLDRMRENCSIVNGSVWKEDGWLESKIRNAFDLPYHDSVYGSTRRDLLRIGRSFVSPFFFIAEKIDVLYAMIAEMRTRKKNR